MENTVYNITIPDALVIPCWTAIAAILITLGVYLHKINIMHATFPKICSALTRISEILFQRGWAKEALFKATSPLSLTEYGRKLLNESGFYDFFEANKKYLTNLVRAQKPKIKYDVEEAAKKVMLELKDDLPKFELVKKYAYNNGIPILKILSAGAIPLRDEVIKELDLKE